MRAEISVQSPMAHKGDMPLVSPKGVMSRQATSCSISVQLAGSKNQIEVSIRKPEGDKAVNPWARKRDGHLLDLPELLGSDLQVVEGSSHSHHHLVAVTGSHADVLPVGLFPLAHEGFGLLTDQSHRGRGDLRRENTSAQSLNNTSCLPSAQGSAADLTLMSSRDLNNPQPRRAMETQQEKHL